MKWFLGFSRLEDLGFGFGFGFGFGGLSLVYFTPRRGGGGAGEMLLSPRMRGKEFRYGSWLGVALNRLKKLRCGCRSVTSVDLLPPGVLLIVFVLSFLFISFPFHFISFPFPFHSHPCLPWSPILLSILNFRCSSFRSSPFILSTLGVVVPMLRLSLLFRFLGPSLWVSSGLPLTVAPGTQKRKKDN